MKKLLVVFAIFALVPVSYIAQAAMIGLSTEELTTESDLVVEGTVDQVNSYWSDDGKRILSSATVAVDETVRGQANQNTVTVEYEGGEVGEIGMKVSDMEPFARGERVLLFLKFHRSSKAGDISRLVGMSQGKYAIGEDGVARKRGFSVVSGGDVVDNDIRLDTLKEKIRAVR